MCWPQLTNVLNPEIRLHLFILLSNYLWRNVQNHHYLISYITYIFLILIFLLHCAFWHYASRNIQEIYVELQRYIPFWMIPFCKHLVCSSLLHYSIIDTRDKHDKKNLIKNFQCPLSITNERCTQAKLSIGIILHNRFTHIQDKCRTKNCS